MKTSELTGPMLDYWTAMAEREHLRINSDHGSPRAPDDISVRIYVGVVDHGHGPHCVLAREYTQKTEFSNYSPSTDGQLGADIIERNKIGVQHWIDGWRASHGGLAWHGTTFLEAAMRVRVWMQFGNRVPEYPD